MRAALAGLLGLLAVLAVAGANVAVWTRDTVLDAQRFHAVVAPLSQDPAIRRVAVDRTVDAVQGSVTDAANDLPVALRQLVATAVGDTEPAVRAAAERVVGSDAFAEVWSAGVDDLHAAAVADVRGEPGDTAAAGTSTEQIVVDLDPLAAELVAPITAGLPAEVSGFVQASVPDLPDLVIPTGPALSRLQAVLAWLDTYGFALVAAAAVLPVLTLLVARRRWAALGWLAAGVAAAAALTWVAVWLTPWLATPRQSTDAERDAIAAVLGAITSSLAERSLILAAAAAAVALVAAAVAGVQARRRARSEIGEAVPA